MAFEKKECVNEVWVYSSLIYTVWIMATFGKRDKACSKIQKNLFLLVPKLAKKSNKNEKNQAAVRKEFGNIYMFS